MSAFKELPWAEHSARPYAFVVLQQSTKKGAALRFGPSALPDTAWRSIGEAKTWCLDQWGISDAWDYQHDIFTFTNKTDAMMFKLRWC